LGARANGCPQAVGAIGYRIAQAVDEAGRVAAIADAVTPVGAVSAGSKVYIHDAAPTEAQMT